MIGNTGSRASRISTPTTATTSHTHWLWGLVLLATGGATFIGLLTLHYIKEHLITRVGDSLALSAADVAGQLDLLLVERYGDSLTLADLPVFQGQNRAAMTVQLQRLLANYPVYRGASVVDAQGHVIAATTESDIDRDLSGDEGFLAARRGQSIVAVETATAEAAATFTARLADAQGRFRGAVITRLGTPTVQEVLAQTVSILQRQWGAAIPIEYQFLSQNGTLLADSVFREEGKTDLLHLSVPSAQLVRTGQPGFVEERHARQGTEVITGYASTQASKNRSGLRWGVLIRVERDAVLAPVEATVRTIAGLGLLGLMPFVGVLAWSARRLARTDRETEQAARRAHAADEQLRHLIDAAPAAVMITDADGRILSVNRETEQTFGYPDGALIGQSVDVLIPERFRAAHVGQREGYVRAPSPRPMGQGRHLLACRRDGTEFSVEISLSHVVTPEGVAIIVIARDVTDRERETQERSRLLHQLRLLLESTAGGIFGLDSEGRCTFINQTGAALLGYRPDELVGRVLHDVVHQGHSAHTPHPVEACPLLESLRTDTPCRFDDDFFRRSDGQCFAAGYTTSPIHDPSDTRGVVVAFADVSERKAAQREIHHAKERAEQEAQAKALILNASDIFFIHVDGDGGVKEWTAAAATLFGIPACDAIGQLGSALPIRWEDPAVHDPQAASATPSFDHLRTLADSTPRRLRVTLPDERKRWVQLSVKQLAGGDTLLVGEDVTEQLRLQRDLAQAQKLESVGQLAAGIAHEINTPMQYIGDNTRFLSESFAEVAAVLKQCTRLCDPTERDSSSSTTVDETADLVRRTDIEYFLTEIPTAIGQTLEGVSRVTEIVRAMKEFAHPDSGERIPTDLNRAIKSTVTVAKNEWKYVADLSMDLDPQLPLVPCYPGDVNQVILNLVVNAAHAMADRHSDVKGTIVIRTRRIDEFAEIRVQDTGTGIPGAIRDKIFDPFFTTKEVGRGTGQGLSISRSVICDKHHGSLTFETCEGVGTTFIVRLPIQPFHHNNGAQEVTDETAPAVDR